MRTTTVADRGLWIRAAVGPALLLAVLASHVSLRTTANLTPWKGGGFGMFSSIDSPATRQVRIALRTDDGLTPVAMPNQLTALAKEVRAAPSNDRMIELGRQLAARTWIVPRITNPDAPPSPERDLIETLTWQAMSQVAPLETVRAIEPGAFDPTSQHRVPVRAVTVTVWRLEPGEVAPDGRSETLRPTQIGHVSVPARPEAQP